MSCFLDIQQKLQKFENIYFSDSTFEKKLFYFFTVFFKFFISTIIGLFSFVLIALIYNSVISSIIDTSSLGIAEPTPIIKFIGFMILTIPLVCIGYTYIFLYSIDKFIFQPLILVILLLVLILIASLNSYFNIFNLFFFIKYCATSLIFLLILYIGTINLYKYTEKMLINNEKSYKQFYFRTHLGNLEVLIELEQFVDMPSLDSFVFAMQLIFKYFIALFMPVFIVITVFCFLHLIHYQFFQLDTIFKQVLLFIFIFLPGVIYALIFTGTKITLHPLILSSIIFGGFYIFNQDISLYLIPFSYICIIIFQVIAKVALSKSAKEAGA